MQKLGVAFLSGMMLVLNTVSGSDWSGEAALEYRHYWKEGDAVQDQTQASVYTQIEYYREWGDGNQSFTFTPFLRLDSLDSERSHFDIREMFWNLVSDDWDVKLGLKKVFWGVAESDHVIDIINQTDQVENPDGEDKLGQPMLLVSRVNNWGIVDVYVLFGFRERTFAGVDGRLRPLLVIDQDNVIYESSAEDKRTDFAVRWSHTLGDWDIGLAHFSGTSREPAFVSQQQAQSLVLVPVYAVIDQTSLDVQATIDAWLWKLEGYTRSGFGERYAKAVAGFEYSFYGVFESSIDIGVIAEYQYDERSSQRVGTSDAWVAGLRFALNDAESTEILAGWVNNQDNDGQSYFLEASRRINDNWSFSVEARGVTGLRDNDVNAGIFYDIRNDDYFQAAIEYYF